MSGALRLTIATPSALLLDVDNVRSVRAEDESGAFGVLPGHADLLTALPPSVLRWTCENQSTRYCALSGGVLRISGGNLVAVACRRGALGDDLETLQAEVAAQRAAELERRPKGQGRANPAACPGGPPADALLARRRPSARRRKRLLFRRGRAMIAPLNERNGKMQDAARLAAERDRTFREDREPTIATRLAQIGVLGWAIVAPILSVS